MSGFRSRFGPGDLPDSGETALNRVFVGAGLPAMGAHSDWSNRAQAVSFTSLR